MGNGSIVAMVSAVGDSVEAAPVAVTTTTNVSGVGEAHADRIMMNVSVKAKTIYRTFFIQTPFYLL
jgi:hypothetical protein